jgi:hypothetical protein
MSTAGHTPNFVAEEAIYPFRVVQFGTQAFSLLQATQSDQVLAGVTDGSVQGFNATTHATAGQVCSLQNGEFVQVTAGGTIVPSDLLIATTDGKVVPAALGSTEAILQAAEAAADGEILWAKKIGAWTLGGGVSPITGGGWPAPESKALWSCEFTGSIPVLNGTPATESLTVWGGGPDFFFQASSTLGYAEQNFFPLANHFGVVEVNCLGLGTTQEWVTVGNAPIVTPEDWKVVGTSGRPGVDIRYDNNEFVVIWKPFSYLTIPDSSITWKAWAGCAAASLSYPDDPAEPAVGFFFRAAQPGGGANWVCVARLINTSTLAAVEYTQSSGVPADPFAPVWRNMKIVTVEGVAPGSYPTIEYYIDSVLVHTFDLNTVASNIRSSVDQEPIFAMMGGLVGAYEDGNRALNSQLDYMHSLTTFTNPR